MDNMYIRGEAKEANLEDQPVLIVNSGRYITTDTYFGCFSGNVYNENTNLKLVRACVTLTGKGSVRLMKINSGTVDELVSEEAYDDTHVKTVQLDFLPSDSCYYLSIESKKNTRIFNVYYEGEGILRETRIAIIICTYRREAIVQNNLRNLYMAISSSEELKKSVDVFCIDNGCTLNEVPKSFKLIPNRNFGGSGGYARGMIEAKEYTHLWLMDDDIKFDSSIIQRAVSFLKFRNSDGIKLAAGMFSFEEPTIQKEATGIFNGYTFKSNASGLNFEKRGSLLKNCIQQRANMYGGWWSLIFPKTEYLPMQFFIKLDDIEYGLRSVDDGRYVIMNGFGVWHEAFGNKANAWSEYYTTRNTLIVQSMYPHLNHNYRKMMRIRLLKSLAYGESKCMGAALQGVIDYLEGPEKFSAINPETRHKEIMMDYGAPLVSNMTRGRMLVEALKHINKPDSRVSILLYKEALEMMKRMRSLKQNWKWLATEEFWKGYLGLDSQNK